MEDEGLVRLCPECGEPIPEKDKHDLCKNCRKALRKQRRKEWWSEHGPLVAAIGIAIGVAAVSAVLSEKGVPTEDCSDEDDDTEDEEYPIGEKYWNREKQRWEKDGKPYTFRVGWTDARDGERHEEEYDDIDQGYDEYEYKSKQWFTKDVTWDHIPPDEESESDEE